MEDLRHRLTFLGDSGGKPEGKACAAVLKTDYKKKVFRISGGRGRPVGQRGDGGVSTVEVGVVFWGWEEWIRGGGEEEEWYGDDVGRTCCAQA